MPVKLLLRDREKMMRTDWAFGDTGFPGLERIHNVPEDAQYCVVRTGERPGAEADLAIVAAGNGVLYFNLSKMPG